MRLVMTLLVRDELDCIETMLDAHEALGVDFFIVTDNGSVDGTRELLAEFDSAGRLRLIDEPADDYAQSEWVTRMARLAATDHGADWVIHADADECWWPVAGNLVTALASVPDDVFMVGAHRYNFVVRPEDDRAFHARMRWRRTEPITEAGDRMAIKVCHRANPDVTITMGNHSVEGLPGAVLDDGRIEILHYSLRTYSQFANKIRRGAAALMNNPTFGPEVGYHWRRAHALQASGELLSEWDAWTFDDERLAKALASGEIVEDLRLHELMLDLNTPSLSPGQGEQEALAPGPQ